MLETTMTAVGSLSHSAITYFQNTVGLITGNDPMVKGLATVGLLSALTVAMRKLPGQAMNRLLRSVSLKVTYKRPDVDKKGTTHELHAYEQFANHLATLANTNTFLLNRTVLFQKHHGTSDKLEFEIGSTSGYFIHNGKLFTFSRKLIDGDKTNPTVDSISLRVLFGTQEDMRKLIPAASLVTKRGVYLSSRFGEENKKEITILNENLEIFIPKRLKNEIDSAIDFFENEKDALLSRGIPWKLTFLFYGPPGTGKTTLISYIAKRMNKSITMPVDNINYTSTSQALRHNAILALEDLDCHDFTHKRIPKETKDPKERDEYNPHNAGHLSALLNCLQGPAPLNGDVIVITTNHIEKLDPAIYRPGRVDYKIHVGFYGLEDLKDWLQFFFRELYDKSKIPLFSSEMQFRPGDLAELYRKHPKDFSMFCQALQVRCTELKEKSDEKRLEEENVLFMQQALKAQAAVVIHQAKELLN